MVLGGGVGMPAAGLAWGGGRVRMLTLVLIKIIVALLKQQTRIGHSKTVLPVAGLCQACSTKCWQLRYEFNTSHQQKLFLDLEKEPL